MVLATVQTLLDEPAVAPKQQTSFILGKMKKAKI